MFYRYINIPAGCKVSLVRDLTFVQLPFFSHLKIHLCLRDHVVSP